MEIEVLQQPLCRLLYKNTWIAIDVLYFTAAFVFCGCCLKKKVLKSPNHKITSGTNPHHFYYYCINHAMHRILATVV